LVKPVRKPDWPVMKDAPARGAALLRVVVGENHALFGNTIDVGCAEAHQSHRIRADIRLPDVIAPDDHDVGHSCRRCLRLCCRTAARQQEAGDGTAPNVTFRTFAPKSI